MLTGILFGLVPAISASRKSLAAALNESSNRAGVGFRSGKVRSLLVVSEMALALVLVIGAALLIRTFMKLQSVDPGFDTHNVLTMAMSISGGRFLKTSGVAQVIHDGTERLNAVPGVTASAAACCLPLQGGFGLPFNIVGRPNGNNPEYGWSGYFPVSWSYFDVFKVPLVRGRNFTEQDNGSAPGVVIINEAMAKQFWPNGDPLSDRIVIGAGHGTGLRRSHRGRSSALSETYATADSIRNPGPPCTFRLRRCRTKSPSSTRASRPCGGSCARGWSPTPSRPPSPTRFVKRRRNARGAHPQHGRDRRRDDLAGTFQHAAAHRFRILGTTDGGDWHLRINGLLGPATNPGTRRQDGSGRAASSIRNMVIRQGMLLGELG